MVEKSSVLIVAGNRLLREALAKVLRKRGDSHAVDAIPYSAELLSEVRRSEARVLILDSVTVQIAGFEILRDVIRIREGIRVLLIGMAKDEDTFLRAVRSGADGYVLDEASASDLLAAVRAVSLGQAVCPPEFCRVLFDQIARPKPEMPNVQVRIRLGLTRREQQLIPLIAQGLTNKEIATHCRISEQTVKNHIHRMLQKVGASDRYAVVDYCLNQGFRVV